MSGFLKYGALFIAGGFYIWAIIILLNNDNWIGISALTTMFLAIAAFWAIWQTRSIQRRERRDRLLNEIIEWAIEATKWRPKKIFSEIIHTSKRLELQHLMFSHIVEIMESFIEMRGKNEYVSNVARKLDRHLEEVVNNLIEVLESKIELLAEWKSILAEARDRVLEENEEGSYFLKAEEQENLIERLAMIVIKEATRIKTRDIT